MFRFSKFILCAFLIALTSHHSGGADSQKAAQVEFLEEALLPKRETGATRFLDQHPEFDGRGVIVAIFDTGVDPGAPGLTTTTTGDPKVIDIIDATGSGDVPMSDWVEAKEGTLSGCTGRTLKIDEHWKNPTGKYRLGLKPAYDIYPGELVTRLKKERTKEWQKQQRKHEAVLIEQIKSGKSKIEQDELQARLDLLRDAVESFNDPGPVYDCMTFYDGKHWRAVIDTDEDGDLADERVLTNYRTERQFATFDADSRLNFSVNVYDTGKLLSIVTVTGNHGTHVAGIVAAHDPEHPKRNGLAPGAQILSVKIGDTRIDGMETGVALIRGLKRAAEMNCDLINMSYGEPTSTPNHGRLVQEFNEIVREKNILFIGSAGNSGPALSTVGAPGGTSSALIGVGAYVSPEMAKVEYSLRDEIAGLPYTWTSRGPTTDGDWGVDIFAPGGAVSPIANYSLRPSQRMNGTSMASPNACGNIALILSGLKNQKKKYTQPSILRSLQATALIIDSVDPLAQGPGLLQVDKAFDHHLEVASDTENIEITASLPTRNNSRGIYLRDAFETHKTFAASVQLQPRLENKDDNAVKLNYEVPLLLQTNADWVKAGSNLLLTNGGANFGVEIDAAALKPGLHLAEVIGLHTEHPERGPLFRVPITVTKPQQVRGNRFTKTLDSSANYLSRTFLTPPEGSRFAELKIKRTSDAGAALLYIHSIQLLPSESFADHQSKSTVALSSGEVFTKKIPVVEGHTLEVCIAQYWSSLSAGKLELEAKFGGVEPSPHQLALPGDGGIVAIDLNAGVQFETCHPSGSLNRWQRHLLPKKSTTKLLSDERDGLWDHQQTWQLVLDYEFELDSKTKIQLTNPPLTELLYDAPLDSHRIFLFDSNNQLVFTEDMSPTDFSAKTGTYKARVELRNTNREALNRHEKLPLVVEHSMKKLDLSFHNSRPDTLQSVNAINKIEVSKGERVRLWTHLPTKVSLPKDVRNGDVLTGTISLSTNDPNPIPVRCVVSNIVVKKMVDTTPKPTTNLQQAEIKFLLDSLKTLDWSKHTQQIEEITNRVNELNSKSRTLLVARLHLADNDDRKERLGKVIELADTVIQSIKPRQISRYFGQKHSLKTAEEKSRHSNMEDGRRDLIDALYRKGRALAYMELPDVVLKNPIKDQTAHDEAFEENFQQLTKWVDTTTEAYFLLHIRRERRKKNYAQAVQLLNKHSKSGQPVYLQHKKRRDLYELLDWKDWQSYEQHWMLRFFPKDRVPF